MTSTEDDADPLGTWLLMALGWLIAAVYFFVSWWSTGANLYAFGPPPDPSEEWTAWTSFAVGWLVAIGGLTGITFWARDRLRQGRSASMVALIPVCVEVLVVVLLVAGAAVS
ncbi:hypothetical protein GCM10009751_18210 [Myceligenerans crystallogenes]|uniref:Uncharacterized protein n=1 Tax=Myceligenerans crystallogenes TaxID=316335 RepID=A0ABP4ZMP7_9MICO